MAAATITTRITINGSIEGLPSGTRSLATLEDENSYAGNIGTTALVDLASGENTINIPTGSTGVVIAPPRGNSTITVRFLATADTTRTGFKLSKTEPNRLTFDGETSFILKASGALTQVEITFT